MLPCWNTRNQENSQAPQRNVGQHGLVQHRVGHSLWKSALLREKAASPWGWWVRGRSTQPNSPHQHLGKRRRGVLHPGVGPHSRNPRWRRGPRRAPQQHPQQPLAQQQGDDQAQAHDRDPLQRRQRSQPRRRLRSTRVPRRDPGSRSTARRRRGASPMKNSRRPTRPSARACWAATRAHARACSDRAVPGRPRRRPSRSTPTARVPISASAGSREGGDHERGALPCLPACRTGRDR